MPRIVQSTVRDHMRQNSRSLRQRESVPVITPLYRRLLREMNTAKAKIEEMNEWPLSRTATANGMIRYNEDLKHLHEVVESRKAQLAELRGVV